MRRLDSYTRALHITGAPAKRALLRPEPRLEQLTPLSAAGNVVALPLAGLAPSAPQSGMAKPESDTHALTHVEAPS